MRQALQFGVIVAALFAHAGAQLLSAAEPGVLVTRIINRIPRTPDEVAAAHDKSNLQCVQLPADSPLAERDFKRQVFYEVKRPGDTPATDSLLYDYGRWPAVSYATQMNDTDRKSLPYFTSSTILGVVNNTYISLQARVHRAAPDGQPYLYYLPYACVGEYGKAEKSVDFADLQKTAVKDVRGLGLFLKPTQERDPRALRTLVVSLRSTMLDEDKTTGALTTRPLLELLFVRLRVDDQPAADGAAAIKLHTFVTGEGLKKLYYFKPYATPDKADACDLMSTIRITEYSYGGQVPSARAARDVQVIGGKEWSMESLSAYAAQAGLGSSFFDSPTEVLDALIDGKGP